MKKLLKLTNEQAEYLYSIISTLKLDASKNRNRWKFLEVIQDPVLDYSDKVSVAKDKVIGLKPNDTVFKKVSMEVNALAKTVVPFTFNDREVFSQGKEMFNSAGIELEGRNGRIYKELEDAFMDVKESD